jgi:NhaP-type Na+/H+ or K+/H+ antiporter
MNNALMTFVGWLVLGFAANVICAATLGLAWHSCATTRAWRSVQAYVLPGLAVGLFVPALLFLVPSMLNGSGLDAGSASFVFFITAIIGIALGGMTGFFAWLIRRPDRDAPNPPTSAP